MKYLIYYRVGKTSQIFRFGVLIALIVELFFSLHEEK